MTTKIQINQGDSYKVGLDEVVGLEDTMRKVIQPVLESIQERVYWNRELSFTKSEYKSRDGFIPFASNCGGLELVQVIPECESHDFSFLEFGEWDGEHHCDGSDKNHCDCCYAQDSEYDAKLRIWFKFEGIQDDGSLAFYLYLGGGNGDAPYFRTKYENTVFEAEFSCKSIAGIARAASPHIKKLLKAIE